MESTRISAAFIASDPSGPLHLNKVVSRTQVEELTAHLVERVIGPCQGALADAHIGPEDIDAVILVGGMTRMPAIRNKVRQIFGKEPTFPVNPDEAVALGAAIYAGIQGQEAEMAKFSLTDITPLSLGCATEGDVNSVIIRRGTRIPCENTERYTTVRDNQTAIRTHVTQGESPKASENANLGNYRLDGIPPKPKGVPVIATTYAIDGNGILTVTAKELETGNEVTITVADSCRLPEAEVERLRKELAEAST